MNKLHFSRTCYFPKGNWNAFIFLEILKFYFFTGYPTSIKNNSWTDGAMLLKFGQHDTERFKFITVYLFFSKTSNYLLNQQFSPGVDKIFCLRLCHFKVSRILWKNLAWKCSASFVLATAEKLACLFKAFCLGISSKFSPAHNIMKFWVSAGLVLQITKNRVEGWTPEKVWAFIAGKVYALEKKFWSQKKE